MGRDAVSTRRGKGTHVEVVCCTIDKDIDSKVIRDAKRLAAGTLPGHIYYCSSLDLTEHRIDTLTADFRAQLPKESRGCGITFLSARKLSDVAERFPELFREWYHSEVRSAEAALQAFQVGQQTTETRGLRLALLSFGSDEAKELRLQNHNASRPRRSRRLWRLHLCGDSSETLIRPRPSKAAERGVRRLYPPNDRPPGPYQFKNGNLGAYGRGRERGEVRLPRSRLGGSRGSTDRQGGHRAAHRKEDLPFPIRPHLVDPLGTFSANIFTQAVLQSSRR